MSIPSPTPAERNAGRKELVSVSLMLAVVVVVVVLAGRASFSSMMYFPHVFGGILSVFALLSLRTATRVLWMPRLVAVLAIIGISVSLPYVHGRAFDRQQRGYEETAMAVLAGRPAPEIEYLRGIGRGFDGEGRVTFGEGVTLLNFWADWCNACVHELPILEAFWREQGASGVRVLGVTKLYEETDDPAAIDVARDRLGYFLQHEDVSYPTVVAPYVSGTHRDYRVESLPSSILVDARGNVVGYGAGVSGTQRLLEEARALVASRAKRDG